ncbi:SusC/RagA family TonB-linked outer membrane protein [Parapedobacter koreensis]|uniref:TonB-linked outer membrane protein, SusC/RagA family n=1 Tax=Parapedobacter koreensis TaxID=332977 RepID=A0A1H7SCT1_9SPHI|nr:SusC/RagA family TonB-linked outer membrane protein [Parapedobacter koreensis]SEL70283.1 TonB-linked outer membrane protein, SusC/RagA family [Parapedobacter koreensis]
MKISTYLALPILLIFGCVPLSFSQQIHRIHGHVFSSSRNTPIDGAVITDGESGGEAVTDEDGFFELFVRNDSTVLFCRAMGFSPWQHKMDLPIPDGIRIYLQDTTQLLEEVVVTTGYESLPLERATGSFTKIDNERLNRATGMDVLGRLEGVTNSLMFDRRSTQPVMMVRGRSTIYAGQAPLVVLDNFPYYGDINNINPNDVESVSILKDAAAASIWGVKAGNGVIVITTKQGAAGQRPVFGFSANATIIAEPDVFYSPVISSADFIEVERFLFGQGFYNNQENNGNRPPLSPVVELLIRQRDGLATQQQTDAAIDLLAKQDVRQDFRKYLYEPGVNQQYALNYRGGSDLFSYYASAGYDRNTGFTGDRTDRVTLRMDQVFSPTRYLKIRAGLVYTGNKNVAGRPSHLSITPGGTKNLYPYARLADENGNALPIVKDYRFPFAGQAEESGLLDWMYRPLSDYRHTDVSQTGRHLLADFGVDQIFLKNFTFQLKYRYETGNDVDATLSGLESYYTRNMVNRFTQADSEGGLTYAVPMGGIFNTVSGVLNAHSGRAQLGYQKLEGNHQVTALGGFEIRQIRNQSSTSQAYGYDEDVLTSVAVDYVTNFPQYHNPNTRARIPVGSGSTLFSERLDRFISAYANAAYTYADKYTASGSIRKDASNLFGVNSNQKGVPLWSAGISWNLHKEPFYRSDRIPYLKLRATYGFSGNVDNGLSAYSTVTYFNGNLNNGRYAALRSYPNPDLRWEKSRIINLGVDFALKNSMVSGSLEYYVKRGTDLIGDAPIDPTVGIYSGLIRRNIAEMSGEGIDIELNGKWIDRYIRWETGLIFNYNTNRLTKYYTDATSGSRYLGSGIGIVPIEGKPLYNLMSYRWRGLDGASGDPLGVVDGVVSTDYSAITRNTPLEGLVYHGPSLSPVFGNLLNTFSWKQLSASVNIGYRFGHYFRRPSISYGALFNNWEGHADFADRWQRPGDEQHTDVPSMVYPLNNNRDQFYRYAETLVDRASSIRLQDVRISYDISDVRQRHFSSIRLFLYAKNLGTLWKATDAAIDPDYGLGIPMGKSFSLGLNMEF